jgi:uncharacterized Zn finger protein (UPF0148 family)
LNAIRSGKLNLAFPGLPNVPSVEALTFTEKIKKVGDLIAREEDSEVKTMAGIETKAKTSTGFLFCPRCGLRKPKDGGLKYCPNCGIKMIEEGPLPYIPKSTSDNKRATKNRIKERNTMEISESIYGLRKQNQFDKQTKVLGSVSGVEKADSGEYVDAINAFSEAIRTNPCDANSYFTRATLKVRIGDIEGARQDFIMCENCHRMVNSNLDDYPLV